MDLESIKKDLQNRFTVFTNEQSAKEWIKSNGYNWITKNNKDEIRYKFEDYIKIEMQKRLENLKKDLELSVNDSLEDSIKVDAFFASTADSWGAIFGGGGAALLTFLVGGAVLWPVAIFAAITGFFIGKEKMLDDFARNIYESSKNVCQNVCEKVSPIIDDMINKIRYMESSKTVACEPKSKKEVKKEYSNKKKQFDVYVKHSTFGEGIVYSVENNSIQILFGQELKKFPFPDAFIKKNGKCFLDIVNNLENSINAIRFFEKNNLLKIFPSRRIKDFVYEIENSWLQECIDRYWLLKDMESRGFIGFLHTTNFVNFKSIYSSKRLLSRNKLETLGISFDDRADIDIISSTGGEIKDCNRFYFRTKTPTNYSAMRYMGQRNPVIFVLKKEFIYDSSAIFYDGNARAELTVPTKSALVAQTFFNWNCIFTDVIPYESDETDLFLKKENCSVYEFKRIKNAEVLFKNELPLEMFDKIYFRTEQDYQNAVDFFGDEKRFEYDHNMFCY